MLSHVSADFSFFFFFGLSTVTRPRQGAYILQELRAYGCLHEAHYVPNSSVRTSVSQHHPARGTASSTNNSTSVHKPTQPLELPLEQVTDQSLLSAPNSMTLYFFSFYNSETCWGGFSSLSVFSYFPLETTWLIQIVPGLKMEERYQIISKVDLGHFFCVAGNQVNVSLAISSLLSAPLCSFLADSPGPFALLARPYSHSHNFP